jgi:hypothetical protein
MSFTTVDNVKMFLNTEELSVFETGIINMLIPMVDGVIKNYCGWNLLETDYTDKLFDGTGTGTLDLRVYPINSIDSLIEISTDGVETDVTDELVTSYDSEDSYLRFKSGSDITSFTAGTKNYKATFNAGFTTLNMPSELTYAASYLVTINYNKITNDMIGVSEGKFNEISAKFDSVELPVLVKRVLDRYRIISIF